MDQHGLSFAELSKLPDKRAPRNARIDPASLRTPAGLGQQANQLSKATLSLGSDVAHSKPGRSETRSQYKPPPADTARQEPAQRPPSQFPRHEYPQDYRSVSKQDYQPNILQKAEPPSRGNKLQNSDNPLSAAVTKAEYTTQAATAFKAPSKQEWPATSSRAAGCPATKAVHYDIIHGGPVSTINPNEAWQAGHNYKKTR